MAASDVQVCNIALRNLREQPIASMTENSEPARLCNAFYADALDYYLARHPHNFALRRAILAQKSEAPAYQYAYAYALPTDPYCIRAYQVWHNGRHWKTGWVVEGRELLTDLDADIYLRFIARVTDVRQYAPTFVEAFSSHLASLLAYPLTRDEKVVKKWEDRATDAWKAHRMADGGEGFEEEPEDGVFVAERY